MPGGVVLLFFGGQRAGMAGEMEDLARKAGEWGLRPLRADDFPLRRAYSAGAALSDTGGRILE